MEGNDESSVQQVMDENKIVIEREYDPTQELLDNPYSEKYIKRHRKKIYDTLSEMMDGKVNRIDCFRNSDLYTAFKLYDKYFFKDAFSELKQNEENIKYFFVFSESETLQAHTEVFYDISQIVIYKTRVRGVFNNRTGYINAPQVCYDRLDCILSTFEHELIHMYLGYFRMQSKYVENGHGPLFRRMNKAVFGVDITVIYPEQDIAINNSYFSSLVKQLKKGRKVDVVFSDGDVYEGILKEDGRHKEFHEHIKVDFAGEVLDVHLVSIRIPDAVEHKSTLNKYKPLSPISSKVDKEHIKRQQNKVKSIYDIAKNLV